MDIEAIEIHNLNDMPRHFEAYTINTPIDKMIKSFLEKHGYEPSVFYRLEIGKTKMLAIELSGD